MKFFASFLGAYLLFLGLFSAWIVSATETNGKRNITLEKGNFFSIVGEVNGDTIGAVLKGISQSDPKKEVILYLDSPGGSVFDGKRLTDYLSTTDRKVTCVANTAISMAFVILQSCQTRLITENGILMSHQISSKVEGSLRDIQTQVGLMEKLENLFDKMISKRLGLTLEAYHAKINPEFWMIGSDEALSNKAVDGIASVKCSPELEKVITKKTEMTIFGPIESESNSCPLL